MQKIGELIRELREKQGYPLRKVAAVLDIDQAVLSKIERGQRKFTKEHILKLADFFNYDKKEMTIAFLSDQIIYSIENEEYGKEALKVAEEKVEYFSKIKLNRSQIIKKINDYLTHNKNVAKAWLFGSFARGENDYESDIDLMIQVSKNSGFSLFDLAEIQYQLEKNIPYKIDVLMEGAIKPSILERIKPDLKLIYERS